ncbi:threonyl-tRNA synthetase, partial [Lecanoromycetidae sp. Uapishka_2]
MVYKTLHLYDYRFVLSTRPKKDYMGDVEEWDLAEDQLKQALNSVPEILWTENEGDGAFYGPKIDVTLRDSDGKEHQTATIQLDFQLPKRFDLEYDAPASELETKEDLTQELTLQNKMGKAIPVMIHRAVLGSLERFMALMLEEKGGKLPFWLSPRQVIVLTVTDRDFITTYAETVRQSLSNAAAPLVRDEEPKPRKLDQPSYIVDIDAGGDSIAQKVARAKQRGYNMICVVGERNIESETVDITFHGQPNLEDTWTVVEEVKPEPQAQVQQDKATSGIMRGPNSVNLTKEQCRKVIQRLSEEYL